jgi:rhodanese-related sulfurtransferase
MVAVAAGAAHSWIHEPQVKVGLRPDPGPPGPAQPAATSRFITLDQALALYEEGTLFLDARTKEQFDKSRINGAYHLSTQEFDTPEGQDIIRNLLSAKVPYVIYCDGGDCDASENLAQRLEDAFPLYSILNDGFPAWEKAGYDVETGSPP